MQLLHKLCKKLTAPQTLATTTTVSARPSASAWSSSSKTNFTKLSTSTKRWSYLFKTSLTLLDWVLYSWQSKPLNVACCGRLFDAKSSIWAFIANKATNEYYPSNFSNAKQTTTKWRYFVKMCTKNKINQLFLRFLSWRVHFTMLQ